MDKKEEITKPKTKDLVKEQVKKFPNPIEAKIPEGFSITKSNHEEKLLVILDNLETLASHGSLYYDDETKAISFHNNNFKENNISAITELFEHLAIKITLRGKGEKGGDSVQLKPSNAIILDDILKLAKEKNLSIETL